MNTYKRHRFPHLGDPVHGELLVFKEILAVKLSVPKWHTP